MPPEVSKLIAAITTLVSALNESAGLPSTSPNPTDDRFDSKKEKVATAPGLLIRFQEPQMSDRVWNKVAQIFAKNFEKLSYKPDFNEEKPDTAVPTIIQQTAVTQEKNQESFFSKLMKYLLPLAALVAGIGLSIAGLFEGPGVLGNSLNLIGKLLTEYGSKFLKKAGEKLLALGDDFIKGAGELLQGGLKLLGIGGGGTLGKTLGGIAAKVGGFLLKAAKFLPFIGSAVSFYFAYKRFQEGDYVGMGLEIASGLLNLIPGFGWIASAIVDVVNITRDFTTTKEERAEGGMGIFDKMLTGIKSWFAENGMTFLRNMPVIGPLMYFWDAYKAGFTTPEGIKNVVKAFGSVFGGGASIIGPAIDSLFALLEEKEEPEGASTAPKKSFWQNVKDFMKRALDKLPWALRKPLEWLGILEKADAEPGPSGFLNFVDNTKEVGAEVLSSIKTLGSGVKDWFVGNLPQAKEMASNIAEKATAFGSGVKDWFVGNLPKAKEIASNIADKATALGSSIKGWFTDALPKAKETGSNILQSISNSAKSFSDSVNNKITSITNSIKEKVEAAKEKFSSVIDTIKGASDKVLKWIENILSWVGDKILKFSGSLLDILDLNSRDNAVDLENIELKIQSPVLVTIAEYSKQQVALLMSINEKMDNLSLNAPAPEPNASPPGPPAAGNGGGIDRGFSSSSLLPIGTFGSIV